MYFSNSCCLYLTVILRDSDKMCLVRIKPGVLQFPNCFIFSFSWLLPHRCNSSMSTFSSHFTCSVLFLCNTVHSLTFRFLLGWGHIHAVTTPLLCHVVTNTSAWGHGSMLADGGLEEEVLLQRAKHPTSFNPVSSELHLPSPWRCFFISPLPPQSSNLSLSLQDYFILPSILHAAFLLPSCSTFLKSYYLVTFSFPRGLFSLTWEQLCELTAESRHLVCNTSSRIWKDRSIDFKHWTGDPFLSFPPGC